MPQLRQEVSAYPDLIAAMPQRYINDAHRARLTLNRNLSQARTKQAQRGGCISTPPPICYDARNNRTARRPRLAARPNAWAAGNRFDRPVSFFFFRAELCSSP